MNHTANAKSETRNYSSDQCELHKCSTIPTYTLDSLSFNHIPLSNFLNDTTIHTEKREILLEQQYTVLHLEASILPLVGVKSLNTVAFVISANRNSVI